MAENFPQIVDIRAIRIFIDDGFNTIVANYGEALEIAFLPVLRMLTIMEHFLQFFTGVGKRALIAFEIAGQQLR